MADSNITKKALAQALKKLMTEKPFEKINISDICELCNMNRKSFYYHFKDKYDLVNWIFDTEFIEFTGKKSYNSSIDYFEQLFEYFYENKKFYRKALQIRGQNCFCDHFREYLIPVILEYIKAMSKEEMETEFFTLFITDAFICSIERWILDKNCMPPEELLKLLKSCILNVNEKISQNIQERETYLG